jgi:hypothetical protein
VKKEIHGVEGWKKEGKTTWRLKKTCARGRIAEKLTKEVFLRKKGQTGKSYRSITPSLFKKEGVINVKGATMLVSSID